MISSEVREFLTNFAIRINKTQTNVKEIELWIFANFNCVHL